MLQEHGGAQREPIREPHANPKRESVNIAVRIAERQVRAQISQHHIDRAHIGRLRVEAIGADGQIVQTIEFKVTETSAIALDHLDGDGDEKASADVFVTGEMSHHEVLAADAGGTAVVLAGHSNTECGF